jgi:23S rRNA C2498 (ribose-2'-O)-methylase RlmM
MADVREEETKVMRRPTVDIFKDRESTEMRFGASFHYRATHVHLSQKSAHLSTPYNINDKSHAMQIQHITQPAHADSRSTLTHQTAQRSVKRVAAY